MLYRLIRPLLFRLSPERAERLAFLALKPYSLLRKPVGMASRQSEFRLLGLKFFNRIGLAAGFDKSAHHIDSLGQLGFGFIEIGTVTPRPQPGNPPPNLFRLIDDEALINRMGFNNDGVQAVVQRLERRRYKGICGVNIGKNADTPLDQAPRDYLECLRAIYSCADYVTINISSPNTPGLRQLQDAAPLRRLLLELAEARASLEAVHGKRLPLLVKIAPDLTEQNLDAIALVLREAGVDGIVATNTTTSRPASLRSPHASEPGGLSGRPLHALSIRTIKELRMRLGSDYPIIGVGGIASARDGELTFAAGADLLQIYTGLIYRGPRLVAELIAEERSRPYVPPRTSLHLDVCELRAEPTTRMAD